MVTRADLGTRPPATIEPPTPVTNAASARQETYARLSQIMLGRQLQAEVLSRFDDGTFMVRIDGTPARMALPEGTRVGDQPTLTLLSQSPRPTFLLNAEPGRSTATLSSAGRLIDAVLQQVPSDARGPAVGAEKPVLPSPLVLAADGTTPQVAQKLGQALEFSGVFYESHLAEWMTGTRSNEQLLQEPQLRQFRGTLPEPAQAGTDARTGLAQANPLLLAAPGSEDKPAEQAALRLLSADSAVTDADTAVRIPGREAIAAEAAHFLPAQLQALEQQRLRWQGELFPGMPMEWEVERDAPERRGARPDQEEWKSAVRFELPSLGAVSASIVLAGDRVRIQIGAASDAAAAMLRERGAELAGSLEAAGTRLDALLVKRDEPA